MINTSLINHLRALESSVLEESKKPDRLLALIQEIETALQNENDLSALSLIDELEEFMDMEFC